MTFVTENMALLTGRPEHVEALKQHILSLAVRGLLVPQEMGDEPAGEVLKRIMAEAVRLRKEGKAKKQRNYPPIQEGEIPFKVPENWVWARLDALCYDFGQKVPDKKFTYIDVGSINQQVGQITDEVKILEAKEAPSRARKIVKRGCIVYSTVRPYLLNIALVDGEFDYEPIASTAFAVINPHEGVLAQYLFWVLRSNFFTKFVETQMVGVAYPAVNDQNLFKGPIPLPPLPEQHRIVAKVASLFALIDRLSAAVREGEETRRRWLGALLRDLSEVRSGEEVRMRWGQLSAHFDELIDSVEAVKSLRKVILQLAVRGVLVEQDAGEEPASELLRKIKAEKGKMGKKGEVLAPVGEGERPFELPRGWEWCRLGEVVEIIMGQSPDGKSYNTEGQGVPLVNGPVEFGKGPFDKTILSKWTTEPTKICEEGDLLICVRGATTGRTNIAGFRACIGRGVASIRPMIFEKYLHYFMLKSRYQILALGTGTTFPSISQEDLKLFLFPLPPLSEQRRIVERVERLMGWCDGLEGAIGGREVVHGKLVNAVNGVIK